MELMERGGGGCKRKRDDAAKSAVMASSSPSTPNNYDIVTVTQWLHSWSSGAIDNGMNSTATAVTNNVLPLIDLRSYEQFNHNHLHTDDATPIIVNLPLETLLSGERSCELPPRHVEFAILVPSTCTDAFVSRNSECSIHKLFFASKSSATQQSRKPWLVRQVILENEDLWNAVGLLNNIECSNSGGKSSELSFRPLPRLWKPDPLVSSGLLPILKEWISNTYDNCQHSPHIVFDLGSGAGRDVCYLAEETKAFYHNSILQQQAKEQNIHQFPLHFVGVDNHKGSARRCEPLWRNRSIDDITTSHLLNLNKLDLVNDCFTNTSFIKQTAEHDKSTSTVLCIYAIRFLNRKLLSFIANSTSGDNEGTSSLCLPTGTIIAISHFCKPTKTAEWNFDHPKVSNVLDRDELSTLFGSKNNDVERWTILKDGICYDGDHGRTLIQFIARKIA